MFNEKKLLKLASKKGKTIVFPEAGFSDRIIEACNIISKKKIANLILIGDESALVLKYKNIKKFKIVNPKTSSLAKEFAEKIYELRKEKGVSLEEAHILAIDPFYFSTMMVREGYADGMVGGAEVSTARNLKPALQLIKTKEDSEIVSTAMIMYGKNPVTQNQPFILADCGLNVNPTSSQLCTIAKDCVELNNKLLKQTSKVAFLSYSTKGSAKGEDVEKVVSALDMFQKQNPYILADGEMQLDSAMIPRVTRVKAPNSKFSEGNANILIFPDLNSGNICYKAISYFAKINAIGPICIGLNKPINDLSRGATVKDIVVLTAITALQCE